MRHVRLAVTGEENEEEEEVNELPDFRTHRNHHAGRQPAPTAAAQPTSEPRTIRGEKGRKEGREDCVRRTTGRTPNERKIDGYTTTATTFRLMRRRGSE